LGDSIVPAIAPAAHAADDPVLRQDLLVVGADVLPATIRMMQQALGGRRRASAMPRALRVKSSVMRSLMAQPTAKRELRSTSVLRRQEWDTSRWTGWSEDGNGVETVRK